MKTRSRQRKPRRASNSKAASCGKTLLNAYEIEFPSGFDVPVNTYLVQRVDDQAQTDDGRGEVVSVVWDYWRQNKHHCQGRDYFVVDLDADRVAVPNGWHMPRCAEFEGYSIVEETSYAATPADPEHAVLFLKLIQQGVKRRFQDEVSEALGPLWKSYRDFCQMPNRGNQSEFCFCRRFIVTPVVIDPNRFVLRISVRTTCLDGRTLDYYYREGKVAELAEMIKRKRNSGTDRKGRPFGVQVWLDESTDHMAGATQLELADPDAIAVESELTAIEQRGLANGAVFCKQFKKPAIDVPLARIRLVLNTDITTNEHRETIIAPDERWRLQEKVRRHLDGLDVAGCSVRLASEPVDTTSLNSINIRPPVVRVLNDWQRPIEIDSPSDFSFGALKERARNRMRCVERNGFLRSMDISLALAWPARLSVVRAKRMKHDLNHILKKRKINFQFKLVRFNDVEHLRRKLADAGHDAVLVVLPEHSSKRERPNDTHEQLKRRLEIPSKCIHHNNTLPEELARIRVRDLDEQGRRVFNQFKQKYRLTLDHLLVKHGWIPFEPAEPFHFNVHVGLDVGGRRNDMVVACLGHGFGDPSQGLSFFTQQIPVERGRSEPIPTDSLFTGLLQMFEQAHAEAQTAGLAFDYESVLFIRDGAMLGAGDAWNELDALKQLRGKLISKALASGSSRWGVAEIHKRAEEWRLFDKFDNAVKNPLVGRCIYDFQRQNEGLLTTTGRPYLSHGTAQVLKVATSSIAGRCGFQEMIQDVAWEADMGFTRPDMGRGLPWVLHGADSGALHASKGYKLIGLMG